MIHNYGYIRYDGWHGWYVQPDVGRAKVHEWDCQFEKDNSAYDHFDVFQHFLTTSPLQIREPDQYILLRELAYREDKARK